MSTRFQISKTMQTKESRETPFAFYNGERGVLARLLDAVFAKITSLGREEGIRSNRQGADRLLLEKRRLDTKRDVDRTILAGRPLSGDKDACHGSLGVPSISRPKSLLEIPGYGDSFSPFFLGA